MSIPTFKNFNNNNVVAQSADAIIGKGVVYFTNTDDELIISTYSVSDTETERKYETVVIPFQFLPLLIDLASGRVRDHLRRSYRALSQLTEKSCELYESGKEEFGSFDYQAYIRSKASRELDWEKVNRYFDWKWHEKNCTQDLSKTQF